MEAIGTILARAALATVLAFATMVACGRRYPRSRETVMLFVVVYLSVVGTAMVIHKVFPILEVYRQTAAIAFEKLGAASVVKWMPNEVEPGGVLTVKDPGPWGREREIVVSPDAAARTRVLAYPRDRFIPRDRNLDFMMWYWDGTNPADGRLVIHRVS